MKVEPVILKGQSVYLEPIRDEHVNGLFSIGQEKEDWLYMPRPCFQSLEDARAWVDQSQAFNNSGEHLCFVIRSQNDGSILGSSRYLNIRSNDRGLEIGYTWMAKEAQRTAANTEAKLLLLTHAFEALKALRVELKTDERNLRSQKAIARIGAKKEGVFRKHMVVQDGFVRNSVYFSIVDDEWLEVKSRLIARLSQS